MQQGQGEAHLPLPLHGRAYPVGYLRILPMHTPSAPLCGGCAETAISEDSAGHQTVVAAQHGI